MENKVKNAYTAYHIDNNESFGNYISVNGITVGNKEFALDIWFYVMDFGNVIISQKNGFSLGVQNNKIVFKHPNMRKQILRQENMERIPEQAWHNLYMGYGGESIKFYIDGIFFAEGACDSNPCDTGEFILGEEFTGYIRSFRVYDKAVTEGDYKKYCFASGYYEKTMPNVTAFMDFTQNNIPDLSGHDAAVHIHEGCSFVDLVGVYCPSEKKFASLSDLPAINPGGFPSGKCSIYTKLYMRPSSKERHVIVANGDIGAKESIVVFSQKETSGIKFGISLGGREYMFQFETAIYTWVDIIISISGCSLTAYINGEKENMDLQEEFKRTQTGDFKIGGCRNAPRLSCGHYLHTVAVFDSVLNQQDALDFMENHPFIFEDGLIALIKFDENCISEQISGVRIDIDRSDLFLAQHTVDVLPDSPYRYRINYTKKAPSEMDKWKARFLVEGYLCVMKEVYGLIPRSEERTRNVLLQYVSNDKTALKQASELYTQPDIGSEDVIKSISDIDETMLRNFYQSMDGILEGTTGLVSTAAVIGTTAVSATCEELYSLLAIGAGIILAISGILLSCMNQLHHDKPDDDDDKKKEAMIHLSSIFFRHKPDDYTCSAIRCRNYLGTVKGEEWNSAQKSVNPAVYIADRIKKVKIKIKFKITDKSEKPEGTYEVSINASVISGNKDLFDTFQYKRSGLIADKEYEAELECEKEARVDVDFSHTEVELFWSGKINNESIVLPNTRTEIYVIPTTPCPPIYMDEGCDKDFVAIEYLDLMADMSKKPFGKNKSANLFQKKDTRISLQKLVDITQELYSCVRLKYTENNRYDPSCFLSQHYITMGNSGSVIIMEFHEKKFLKALKKAGPAPIEIECDVYAAILAYKFSLWNVFPRISYVVNPLHENQQNEEYKPLRFVGVYPAGQASRGPQNIEFTAHLLVEVVPHPDIEGMDEALIFDASMGVMQNGTIRALAGYPFRGISHQLVERNKESGTYRGMVIENGTGAEILYNRYFFVRA